MIVKQPKGINPYYGSYYMNSVARSHVNEQQVGVALIHFNTKSMALLSIPVAPYQEQEEIVQRVQELFKSAALIEQQYEETKAKLEHLDRSILAKAFRGELVEQDLNDEPASVFLERIRVDREQQTQGKAKKPGKKGQRTIKAE